MAAEAGYRVVAWDQDAGSVEAHWRRVRGDGKPRVLPLILDLANPSPAIGWALEERGSFLERGEPDAGSWRWRWSITSPSATTCRSGRWPASSPASRRSAIVEFVPKEDPMTRRLLAARRDIFDGYTIDGFRAAFGEAFDDRPRGADRGLAAHALPARAALTRARRAQRLGIDSPDMAAP